MARTPWLQLQWRPFRFQLPQQLVTAHGALRVKRGWLLRLEAGDGRLGWGEAAALDWQGVVTGGMGPPQAVGLPPGGPPSQYLQAAAGPGPRSPLARPSRDGEPLLSSLPPESSGVTGWGRDPAATGSPQGDGRWAGACAAAAPPPRLAPGAADAAQHGPSGPAAARVTLMAPLAADPITAAIGRLPRACGLAQLEDLLPQQPPSLAFALGLALAELEGLGSAASGGWLPAPASAQLLPAGEAMPAALEAILAAASADAPSICSPLTVKWKVAAGDDGRERQLLEWLLQRLPAGVRLRLDANGGWGRATAAAWAERLAREPRLEWLEQPLPPADVAGLWQLAQRLPVALDESLRPADGRPVRAWLEGACVSEGRQAWPGWLVRRPALEGDPRPLLAQLQAGTPRLMLSTALETGIGGRLIAHLAALQQRGPTPTAPGLAPGWCPPGGLFCTDPAEVWRTAAQRP